MRVTVTAGTGACNHLTIRDVATGAVLRHATLVELRQAGRGDDDPFLARIAQVVRTSGATTKAQARTAIEAADL